MLGTLLAGRVLILWTLIVLSKQRSTEADIHSVLTLAQLLGDLLCNLLLWSLAVSSQLPKPVFIELKHRLDN